MLGVASKHKTPPPLTPDQFRAKQRKSQGSAQPGLPSDYGSPTYPRDRFGNPVPRPPHHPAAAPLPVSDAASSGPGTGFWQIPVRQRQQMLRNAGYDVTVDGMAGPQTLTASKAYLKGIPASYWNLAWKRNHQVAAPAPAQVSDAGSNGPPRIVDSASPPPAAPAPPAGGGLLQQLIGRYLSSLGTPIPGPKDLAAQAAAIAAAELGPQTKFIQDQQQQAQADARRNAQFQANLAAAMAGMEKSIGPATQADYQSAGQDQAAFSKGFSSDLTDQASADAAQTNDFLKSIGAPAGQMLATGVAQNAGDVLYGLGGYIPANQFSREGAAYTAAADRLPATALGVGQQNARDQIKAGQDTVKTLEQQLMQLQSTRPGLVHDALSQLEDYALKTRAQHQNDLLAPLALAQQLDGLPGTNYLTGQPTTRQQQLEIQLGNQQVAVAKMNNATKQWAARFNLDQKKLALQEWKAAHPKQAGVSPGQILQARKDIVESAHDAFYGVTDKSGQFMSKPKTYQEALYDLTSEFGGVVPMQFIVNQLNRYWTKPGYEFDPNARENGKYTPVPSATGRPKTPIRVSVRKKTKR